MSIEAFVVTPTETASLAPTAYATYRPLNRSVLSSAISAALLSIWMAPALAQTEAEAPVVETAAVETAAAETDTADNDMDTIVVTARRREEDPQEVPIAVSVIGGDLLTDTGAFNVNRLKELIPTVQFYSSNPRNSAINIRGLGAPYGLTNDGLEPGVGLYIDGVFQGRPAAATLDFIDVQQIEVLRGPQGTLYGKNTTAGAINVTTRKPSFTPETTVEQSFGNYGFVQSKFSTTGGLTEDVAARLSFSGTQRDGFLYNTRTQDDLNDLNNIGIRGQLLWRASDTLEVTLAADYNRQRPEGYAQVYAGVAPTLRPANRQYATIAAELGYTVPSTNPFDRLTDTDVPWISRQDLGGAALTADWSIGPGKLTSITAWRYWDWQPSNDRDFLGLEITTLSASFSKQKQWTQELRYAGDWNDSVSFTTGVFLFKQSIDSAPFQQQGQGKDAARFLLNPGASAYRADLLTGYGQNVATNFDTETAAIFGQLDWKVTDKFHILPGLRYNYDKKKLDYVATTYGGPTGLTPAQIALQQTILPNLAYVGDASDTNFSGQLTASFQPTEAVNTYATYAKSYKSVGLNNSGVPFLADNVTPALNLVEVKPEDVNHFELGLKTRPTRGTTFNFAVFDTEIKDFQAQVTNGAAGTLRGYLANAEKVRVKGAEFDATAKISNNFNVYAAGAYTDGKYKKFTDAPTPLELTAAATAAYDASGTKLPGISKWAGSVGGEYRITGNLLRREGDYFFGADTSYRSKFSSSATYSDYLNIDGYGLINTRLGFRGDKGWEATLWVRNVADKDYFELLSAAPGNTGLFVGQPGDPRTYGLTLRATF